MPQIAQLLGALEQIVRQGFGPGFGAHGSALVAGGRRELREAAATSLRGQNDWGAASTSSPSHLPPYLPSHLPILLAFA